MLMLFFQLLVFVCIRNIVKHYIIYASVSVGNESGEEKNNVHNRLLLLLFDQPIIYRNRGNKILFFL